ncbi:MAG: ABC transporter ATP-binding protein [Micrococcales bacterium]|nr:ABC transporter ATP-binding protein [Micrococcales bacterium]
MGTLTMRGVRKTYGKTIAVADMDLEVGDGEFFVILGPSGAGKTTTLKAIAGLVDIDTGEVSINSVDMTGVEPYHRNVAMAFESYALYPQKTVAQNLASPLRSGRSGTFSETDQQKRIDAVTTTLGINHLQQRLPRELSNGQRQRTALGRVLVRPADIYLLDEPLSHLDAKLRASMRAELKQIAQTSSTTTVYVTHDYQEALALGDRIAILRAGRFVQIGTPEQVWRSPVDSFVATSLGQPEMNLLDGVVGRGQIAFLGDAGRIPVWSGGELRDGQRVRLGLRPSDLELDRGHRRDSADRLTLRGRVILVERLGRHVELAVHVSGQQLIVVEDSDHAPAENDEVTVQIKLANVHVFDGGDTGEATLRLGSATGPGAAARPEEAQQ